jgi:hypothetical protein
MVAREAIRGGAGLRPLHTRRLQVDAFELDDEHVLLEGFLIDDGHVVRYHHLNQPVPPGVIHHMALRLVVSWQEGRIEAIEATMPHGAVPSCDTITPQYQSLLGASLARGFNRQAMARIGGALGCSHLTTLLLEMQRTFHQTRAVRPHQSFLPEARLPPDAIETYRPPMFGACHQYSEGGEYIRDIRAFLRERAKEESREIGAP